MITINNNSQKINLGKDFSTLELAFDNVSESIIIVNRQGNVLYANKTFTKHTGYSSSLTKGTKIGSRNFWGANLGEKFFQ